MKMTMNEISKKSIAIEKLKRKLIPIMKRWMSAKKGLWILPVEITINWTKIVPPSKKNHLS